ncbi:hypothetical protein BGW36DRAFT_409043 [Talaromyces proteolyticus]|uniref:DUF7626 domain-containing protein n=1 Tax=Talaromyces proteolyticus TaxID=1131652 RepID=A0AAD4KTA7_9EURO|nr:uncharacterized protein BGW36DRAFT_409043 [Talaromyces proteolyticus]KAH8695465.1 hypothetical protein BGW36DRAFT_409043 [Talaromyces proteolyticus]
MVRRRPPKKEIHLANRVKINDEMIIQCRQNPRFMPPYFSHERLSDTLYQGDLTLAVVDCLNNKVIPCDTKTADSDEEWNLEDNSPEFMSSNAENANPDGINNSTTSTTGRPQIGERVVVGCTPVGGKGKRVCAVEEMDEDDRLLFHLKLAKWTEREIHKKFGSENRINYSTKTIGTRFSRMRRFITQDNDKRLVKGDAVWFESEESLLPKAYAFATTEINKERRSLEKRKWDLVAEYIQRYEPVAMYSGEACRKHYEELRSGTAPMVPEKQKHPDLKTARLLATRKKQAAYINRLQKADRPKV